jgi:hypothetical protein
VRKSRAEARGIVEKLGYGPDKRLEVKVSERNIAIFRDPAVILIDQLKEIYIDGARPDRDRQLVSQDLPQRLPNRPRVPTQTLLGRTRRCSGY